MFQDYDYNIGSQQQCESSTSQTINKGINIGTQQQENENCEYDTVDIVVLEVTNIRKGKLLETLPNWGRAYTVEADITVTKNPSWLSAKRINIFSFSNSFCSNFSYDIPFLENHCKNSIV